MNYICSYAPSLIYEYSNTYFGPKKVVLDGEIIGTTPIEVECSPNGLTVLAPPTNEAEEKSAWGFLS